MVSITLRSLVQFQPPQHFDSLRSLSAGLAKLCLTIYLSLRSEFKVSELKCTEFIEVHTFFTKMWFIYILRCDDGSFYTGTTNDVERRFHEHRDKKGGRYTKNHKVNEILYFENFITQGEALSRERQIKGWTHKKKENLINFGKPKPSAV